MKDISKLLLTIQSKANHFTYSLLLSLVFFVLLSMSNKNVDSISLACFAGLISFAFGLNKDSVVYSFGKGTLSWLDILANACGVVAFVLIIDLVSVL